MYGQRINIIDLIDMCNLAKSRSDAKLLIRGDAVTVDQQGVIDGERYKVKSIGETVDVLVWTTLKIGKFRTASYEHVVENGSEYAGWVVKDIKHPDANHLVKCETIIAEA